MRFNTRFVWAAALAGASALAFACSSVSLPTTNTNTNPTSPPVTQHVTAAAGGVVTDKTGAAKLSIPAGALSADLDITLNETAAESGTVSAVYNFGPEGTQFSTPASLVLQMPSGVTVPSGKTPTLATYDGTKWAAITGSQFAAGAVTGPVAHFSKFTIILVDGQVTVTNSCSDTVTSFAACGGDVTGTWNITDFCAANGVLGADPTDGGCPGVAWTIDVTPSGSVTFNADGSYTQTATTLAVNQALTFPTSSPCFTGKTCDPTSINFNVDGGTCATSGANCTCSGGSTQTSAAKTGTYTATGNNLATDGQTGSPYCVKSGKLYVQANDKNGKLQFLYVATKQ